MYPYKSHKTRPVNSFVPLSKGGFEKNEKGDARQHMKVFTPVGKLHDGLKWSRGHEVVFFAVHQDGRYVGRFGERYDVLRQLPVGKVFFNDRVTEFTSATKENLLTKLKNTA